MGEQAEDHYAERREEIEQAFRSLPRPNTPQYWQALTSKMANGKPLPLEVLARCWRWWGTKYRKAEQDGIFEIIMGRVQKHVAAWANKVALSAPGKLASGVNEDLEQECYLALCQKLGEKDTFFEVSFFNALEYLEQHIAQQKMEQEGYRVRKGVKQPRRIPANQINPLDDAIPGSSATTSPGSAPNNLTLAEVIPDPTSEMAFANAEFLLDFAQFARELTAEQRKLLYFSVYEKAPQREIAERLGISDRAVRYKVQHLYDKIRAYLYTEAPEEADTYADRLPDIAPPSSAPDTAPARAPRKDTSHAE